MLNISIPATELWDEKNEEFIYVKEQSLQLEHSLVSISKWESKHCKPYLSTREKTDEETLDYIRCMTLTQNVKPIVYKCLSQKNMKEILDYIDAPMTATTFSESDAKRGGGELVTSEIIYYWMIAFGIPFECRKWHLNRLLTLIKVCSIKSKSPRRMSRRDIAKQNTAINALRKKRYGTRG